MIVQCERCGTKYRFDDSKIGIQGITVKCSRCKNVFKVFHPLSLDEEAIFGVRKDAIEGPSLNEWQKEFAKTTPPRIDAPPLMEEGPPPKAFVPPAPEEISLEKEEEAEELPSLEEEFIPISSTPVSKVIPPKKERKVSRTFLLSILLLVLLSAAIYYWHQKGTSIPLFESIYERISKYMGGKNSQKLFLLYLKGSEYKLEGGKVFVIQGKVANRSQEIKKYVKLQGSLFSKDGKILATNIGYGGRTLADEEIKNSTYDSLKLSFGFASPGQASPVHPQESVPFTIIFFSPPTGAAEYQVAIAEETPKK